MRVFMTIKTVCAPGTGTFVDPDDPVAGWSTTTPRQGTCKREEHPGYNSGLWSSPSCNISSSPWVYQSLYVNPPECVCRPCPARYTSLGGPSEMAVCFSIDDEPEAFGIHFALVSSNNTTGGTGEGRALAELPALIAAGNVARAFAEILSTTPLDGFNAVHPIGNITLDGEVRSLQPIEYRIQPYKFFARYTFRGSQASRDAIVEALNTVPHGESIGDDADKPALICAAWLANIGMDVCGALAVASPDYVVVLPWAQALEVDEFGPMGPLTFWPTVATKLLVDSIKSFETLSKSRDGYRDSKKPDGKPWALDSKAGIADGIFSVVGVFFGIHDLVAKPEDKTMEVLNQINQTTTETLDRVKQLQSELVVVENQLTGISSQLDGLLATVKDASCLNLHIDLQTKFQKLNRLWSDYYDGASSVLATTADQLQTVRDFAYFDRDIHEQRVSWAKDVWRDTNVYSIVSRDVHEALVGTAGRAGVIQTCEDAFFAKWRLDNARFPLDDRQYYNPMITYMVDRISRQTQGVRCV